MLTVADLRTHVTSVLEDSALEMLLGAAYEVIDERVGSDANVTELVTAGPGPLLMLSRKPRSIVSVIESEIALGPTDYELRGRVLLRLHDGANPARWWRGRVDVTYAPIVSQDVRDLAAIQLVQLDLDFNPGATSERIGDWAETVSTDAKYVAQRDDILAAVMDRKSVV